MLKKYALLGSWDICLVARGATISLSCFAKVLIKSSFDALMVISDRRAGGHGDGRVPAEAIGLRGRCVLWKCRKGSNDCWS